MALSCSYRIIGIQAAALLSALLTVGMGSTARASKLMKVTVTPDNLFHDIEPSFFDSLRLLSVAAKLEEINEKSYKKLESAIQHEYARRGDRSLAEILKRDHYLALIKRVSSGFSLRLEFITSQVSASNGDLLLGYAASNDRRWVMLIDRHTGKPRAKLEVTTLATEEAMELLSKYAERKWTTFMPRDRLDETPEIDLRDALGATKRSKHITKLIKGGRFLSDPEYDRLCLRLMAQDDLLAAQAH